MVKVFTQHLADNKKFLLYLFMQYEKLDPEFKAKWVKALRSGRYEQGRAGLYSENQNTYCCLGVACSILDIDNHVLNGKLYPNAIFSDIIPKLLVSNTKIINSLVHKNDGYRSDNNPTGKVYSFNEIADWIETNL